MGYQLLCRLLPHSLDEGQQLCRGLQMLAYIATTLRALAEELANASSILGCLGVLHADACEKPFSIGSFSHSHVVVTEDVLHVMLMALQS